MQGYYATKYAIPPSALPRAFLADRLSLSLPMYAGMTDEELDYVARALRSVVDV
jgi:dTDP-4-amino-4,6-dideoxygalactose transaminase